MNVLKLLPIVLAEVCCARAFEPLALALLLQRFGVPASVIRLHLTVRLTAAFESTTLSVSRHGPVGRLRRAQVLTHCLTFYRMRCNSASVEWVPL